jgi:hypothetical protein
MEITKEVEKKIVFICDRHLIHFFEDYINTFHHIFNVEIYLFTNQDHIQSYIQTYSNPTHSIFIFMQSIPYNICENIQYYIDRQYKLCIFNTIPSSIRLRSFTVTI